MKRKIFFETNGIHYYCRYIVNPVIQESRSLLK